MPETKDVKSRWKDVGIALKHLFKPQKKLDQETLEVELEAFAKEKGL